MIRQQKYLRDTPECTRNYFKRDIMIVDRNSEFGGIDLSLNRSLEELIDSYYEAHGAGIELDENTRPEEIDAYYALENYLADFGAI